MQKKYPSIVVVTHYLLFIIIFFFIAIITKGFLIPIVFGMLIASLLYPVSQLFIKIGFHKGLAIFVTIIMMMAAFGGVSLFFADEVSKLTNDFPQLKEKAIHNVNEISMYIEETVGIKTETQKNWVKDQVNNLFVSGSKVMNEVLNATAGTVFKILLMPVFVFYLLFYRERFHIFLMQIVPHKDRGRANKIIKEISFVSQRYMGGATIVVLILSILNAFGLYIIGLKYAILFGVISALFNYIPYFGTWIGAFFPFTFALLTGDSPNLAIGVFFLFLIIQFTENNILTPNITGGYVRLNPFVTILALIAGAKVWGVAGMLLIIPFIASLKIIFDHFESTKPLAFILARPENDAYWRRVRKIKSLLKRKESGNNASGIEE